MKARSFQGEITRASLWTTMVVLLLCAGALVLYESTTYRANFVSEMRSQGDLIAQASAAALVFDDRTVAGENLALFRLQPRVQAAALYGREGRLFGQYTADGGAPAPPQQDAELLRRGFRFNGPSLELAMPVLHEGGAVGSIYLQARHDLWGRVLTYAAIVALVMVAGLAIAVAVFDRLLRNVTRPLQQMTDVARDVVAQRRWNLRAPATDYDDIAVLVAAFNAMLAEVESRTGALEVEMAVRVRAEQDLRQADRRKDEFLATLAHELRNPLAPMTTSVALLRAPVAREGVRERALAIIERQLGHMVRLIEDLLDVSRVSTGKLSLQRETVDLVALVQAAVETAQPPAQHKGLTLQLRTDMPALWIEADPARLSQVLSNLLNNACRYTPAGGSITVALAVSGGADGQAAQVSVQDTGVGIDPAIQGRIFELFEQGDKSLERGNVGLGIGLTLARQLVQLHGGEVAVHSDGPGKGSVFTVRLPLAAVLPAAAGQAMLPALALASAPGTVAQAAAGHGLRVLLADDNVDFATSQAELLSAAGYEVHVVHDGLQALAAATATPPHIALLDIGMPKLNGYELARRLRAGPGTGDIKLVAISGWGQPADKQAAFDAGYHSHLVKPVVPARLLAVMAALAAH